MTPVTAFTAFESQLPEAIEDSRRGFAHVASDRAHVCPRLARILTDEEFRAASFAETLGDRSCVWVDDGFVDSTGPTAFTLRTLQAMFESSDFVLVWNAHACSEEICAKVTDFVTDATIRRLAIITTAPGRVDDWMAVIRQHATPGTKAALLTSRKVAA